MKTNNKYWYMINLPLIVLGSLLGSFIGIKLGHWLAQIS